MTAIVRIDDELVGVEDFVKILKLTGQFQGLIEQLVRDKLTVRAAKRHGINVTPDEIQERADQFRRIQGLHRAADTNQYFDALGITLDDFEVFITDSLYQEKMMEKVCSERCREGFCQRKPDRRRNRLTRPSERGRMDSSSGSRSRFR